MRLQRPGYLARYQPPPENRLFAIRSKRLQKTGRRERVKDGCPRHAPLKLTLGVLVETLHFELLAGQILADVQQEIHRLASCISSSTVGLEAGSMLQHHLSTRHTGSAATISV